MRFFVSTLLLLFILIACSTNEVQYTVIDDKIIIQLTEVIPQAEEYYAEITNTDGRRFSVNLGLPDNKGQFRIRNDFGEIVKIEVMTNLDFE